MAEEPDGDTMVLRVAIQGGGCSGFQYGLGFDTEPAEGDLELALEGVNVVVDPFSVPYLQGATIDFLTGLQESGFKIDNPNAASSCGCGHSFQVEEGAEGETAPDATPAAAAPAARTDLAQGPTLFRAACAGLVIVRRDVVGFSRSVPLASEEATCRLCTSGGRDCCWSP